MWLAWLVSDILPGGGGGGEGISEARARQIAQEEIAKGATPTGAAGGDLEGSNYPSPVVAPEKITLAKLAAAVIARLVSPLVWENVEAVNVKLEQTVTIQVAVFNGLVFMRGLGKTSAEIPAKGILFTLPPAARPTAERHMNILTTFTTTTQSVTVKVNGEVELSTVLLAAKTPVFDGLVIPL